MSLGGCPSLDPARFCLRDLYVHFLADSKILSSLSSPGLSLVCSLSVWEAPVCNTFNPVSVGSRKEQCRLSGQAGTERHCSVSHFK